MEELKMLIYVVGAVLVGCVAYTALNILLWMTELFSFGV